MATSYRVFIKQAGPMQLDFQGVQTTTALLAGTGLLQNNATVTLSHAGADVSDGTWHIGDQMTITSPTNYLVSTYTVKSAYPPRGLLGVWTIEVQGAVR